ncbi:Homeodomain-like protein [Melampsora americana]|nr:Homeodomain-like protein [Melampsora americana]KAH9813667.1 Homeodomain-like protein [Melampsora americana]
MQGLDRASSDGSEKGFNGLGSRPTSGGGTEQVKVAGDEGESEKIVFDRVQQTPSPLDGLERSSLLQAFTFTQASNDELSEHQPTFTTPSPSALAPSRTPARSRSGPGRTQHPLDPIPGPPPPTLHKAKGPWHKAEDASLMYWVSHLGTGKWVEIARRVGSRTGKQCRERWTNQLSPDIDHSAFRHDEDLVIITMQQTLQANKWCEVAKYLPGRPENAIK